VLSRLRNGEPPETVAQALVAAGVPPETAQRIVRAVEQELALDQPDSALIWKRVWWTVGLGLPFAAVAFLYGNFLLGGERLNLNTLLPVAGVIVGLSVILVAVIWKSRGK